MKPPSVSSSWMWLVHPFPIPTSRGRTWSFAHESSLLSPEHGLAWSYTKVDHIPQRPASEELRTQLPCPQGDQLEDMLGTELTKHLCVPNSVTAQVYGPASTLATSTGVLNVSVHGHQPQCTLPQPHHHHQLWPNIRTPCPTHTMYDITGRAMMSYKIPCDITVQSHCIIKLHHASPCCPTVTELSLSHLICSCQQCKKLHPIL